MNIYRTIVFLLSTVLWTAASQAQNPTIHFGYDANGNRTSRTLSLRKVEENGRRADTVAMPATTVETADTFGKGTLTPYPNPTHGRLTVSLEGTGGNTATAEIATVSGNIILRRELTAGSHDFDLSGLPPGVYLLHLTAAEVSQTWKIIKQ